MAPLRAALLVVSACAAAAQRTTGSVYYDAGQGTYSFKSGVLDPAAVAWGSSTDMAGTASGFGQLTITTNKASPDAVQMMGAGYLEGSLTTTRISSHYVNVGAWIRGQFKGGVIPQTVIDFFSTQDAWARANVAANTSSPVWRATGLVTAQLDGLISGYNANAANVGAPQLTQFQFQQMNAIGDLLDLIPALKVEGAPEWTKMSDEELMDRVRKTTHCSALVKVNGDLSELFFSHAAWFIYTGSE